jgi:hypothetical protein
MILYPTAKAEREQRRTEVAERAAERALKDQRSSKCAGRIYGAWGREMHAPECKGGPERCLCECHDEEVQA